MQFQLECMLTLLVNRVSMKFQLKFMLTLFVTLHTMAIGRPGEPVAPRIGSGAMT